MAGSVTFGGRGAEERATDGGPMFNGVVTLSRFEKNRVPAEGWPQTAQISRIGEAAEGQIAAYPELPEPADRERSFRNLTHGAFVFGVYWCLLVSVGVRGGFDGRKGHEFHELARTRLPPSLRVAG